MKTLILSLILISGSSVAARAESHARSEGVGLPLPGQSVFHLLRSFDWKKQLFNFDALAIQPWLDRVAQTKTDLDFYEVCVAYVASLNDTHDSFYPAVGLRCAPRVHHRHLRRRPADRFHQPHRYCPSRTILLPSATSCSRLMAAMPTCCCKTSRSMPPGQIPVQQTAGSGAGSPSGPNRSCRTPRTVTGKSATVVIQRQSGATETYTIPWTVTGTPLTVGPVPSPKMARSSAHGRACSNLPSGAGLYDRTAQRPVVRRPESRRIVGLNGYGSRNPLFVDALGQCPLHAPPGRQRGRFLLFGHVHLRRPHHRLYPDSELFAHFHRGRIDAVREGDRLLQCQYGWADRG